MDKQERLQPISRVGSRIRIIGVVILLLGVLSVALPNISGMTVSALIGIVLIFSGIARTAFAWMSSGWGSMFAKSLAGILTILAGGYMVFNPDIGSQALSIVLTIYLFADGITTMIFALRMPPAAGGAWMMFGAIISLLAGIFMYMQWPASGELAIGVLIGIKLIIDGVVIIGVGTAAKSLVD